MLYHSEPNEPAKAHRSKGAKPSAPSTELPSDFFKSIESSTLLSLTRAEIKRLLDNRSSQDAALAALGNLPPVPELHQQFLSFIETIREISLKTAWDKLENLFPRWGEMTPQRAQKFSAAQLELLGKIAEPTQVDRMLGTLSWMHEFPQAFPRNVELTRELSLDGAPDSGPRLGLGDKIRFYLVTQSLFRRRGADFVRECVDLILTRPIGETSTEGNLERLAAVQHQDSLSAGEVKAKLFAIATGEQYQRQPITDLSIMADNISLRLFRNPEVGATFLRTIRLLEEEDRETLLRTLTRSEQSGEALGRFFRKQLRFRSDEDRITAFEGYLDLLEVGVSPVAAAFAGKPPLIDALLSLEHFLEEHREKDGGEDRGEQSDPSEEGLQMVKEYVRWLDRSPSFRSKNEFEQGNHLSAILSDLVKGVHGREVLSDPALTAKLLLCLSGKGLPPDNRISSRKEHAYLLADIAAHGLQKKIFSHRSPEVRSLLHREYVKNFKGDNPPFSLVTTSSTEQSRFQRAVYETMHRQLDPYYGFWSQTYTLRHTGSGRCAFDEFTTGIAQDVQQVHANDINRFPGRGRLVSGLEPGRIFAPVPGERNPLRIWKEEFLQAYGPSTDYQKRGNLHALDNLPNSSFLFLRGMIGISCPSNDFFRVNGEHMSLVLFNQHFHAEGQFRSLLVPSRVLASFIEGTLQPLSTHPTDAPAKDICDSPPTVQHMGRRAKEMRTAVGVIDLSAGSNFTGGLCNGFEFGSKPFHDWETNNCFWFDSFGRAHKYTIRAERKLLSEMLDAHYELAAISKAYYDLFDLFKIAQGFDARGVTFRKQGALSDASDGRLGFELDWEQGGDNAPSPEISFDEQIRQSALEQPDSLSESTRLLEFLCEFSQDFWSDRKSKKDAPILILAPMHRWSEVAETPFVIDGGLRYIFSAFEKPVEFEVHDGHPSQRLLRWWSENAVPILERDSWLAPRLVARDNYQSQIAKYSQR